MSDTANVMKGCRSGVQKLMRDEMPHLYDVGCIISHSADFTMNLGFSLTFFTIFCIAASESRSLLIYCVLFSLWNQKVFLNTACPTWLSLLRCVGRYIDQFQGLISTTFFLLLNRVQTFEAFLIGSMIPVPNKHFIFELICILPSMDRFSRLFQKLYENTTCEHYTECIGLFNFLLGIC